MEFRSRPKSDYLQSAHWQELHALATHWKSDMNFFEDELRFIDLLIDKYFRALIEQENIAKLKVVASKLGEVKTRAWITWHGALQRTFITFRN
jgi:hypothetical protein